MSQRIVWACAFGLLLGCGGGAPKLAVTKVSGTITYKGAPVDDALVTFATEKSPRTAVGVTDAQGKFKLTTINTDDGAVPGDHAITIVKRGKPGASQPLPQTPEDYLKIVEKQGKGNTQPPTIKTDDKSIPAKYKDPSTSGLKRTVVEGEANDFTIDLSE
jgi:hypothetical protein